MRRLISCLIIVKDLPRTEGRALTNANSTFSKLQQLTILSESPGDALATDFQRILRPVSNRESDYASHNMHAYPAKFIPYYPHVFVKNLTKPGDVVVDPMCGAGTTLIESCLLKRSAFGVEIDPTGFLISSVCTSPLDESKLVRYVQLIVKLLEKQFHQRKYIEVDLPSQDDYPNFDIWFRDETLKQLLLIKQAIADVIPNGPYFRFVQLCLSSIVRDVSNADPRDIFPQRDANQKIRPKKDVLATFIAKLEDNKLRIRDYSQHVSYSQRARVTHGDARNLPYENDFADLVFTSPPYAYAIDYARVHQLSTLLLFMNNASLKQHRKSYIGTDRISISLEHPTDFAGFRFARPAIEEVLSQDKKCGLILYQYFRDMAQVTRECFRVLKPGGHLVYVVGNSTIRQTALSTDAIFEQMAIESGLRIERTFDRPYFVYRMARKRNKQSNTIKKDVFIVCKK